MKYFDPKQIEISKLYSLLSDAVTPRPIAFVSTVDSDGNKNLSPFSFFGMFSINPPILVFSPTRRIRNNTTKHTLENVKTTKEAVICLVNQEIAQQMSLASTEYPDGINEFEKAGFTALKSKKVQPALVKESPINFECKVNDVLALGEEGGAGNMVICEVVGIHINENVLDKNEKIDPLKLDIVSRYGGNWYGRTTEEGLFEMEKPISKMGVGFDLLPTEIKNSSTLTGHHLAILASIEMLPKNKKFSDSKKIHEKAKLLIDDGKVTEAWKTLELR